MAPVPWGVTDAMAAAAATVPDCKGEVGVRGATGPLRARPIPRFGGCTPASTLSSSPVTRLPPAWTGRGAAGAPARAGARRGRTGKPWGGGAGPQRCVPTALGSTPHAEGQHRRECGRPRARRRSIATLCAPARRDGAPACEAHVCDPLPAPAIDDAQSTGRLARVFARPARGRRAPPGRRVRGRCGRWDRVWGVAQRAWRFGRAPS